MPVTQHQAAIAKLLAVNRSPDSYLAGGAALHFEPQTIRYSNDLDYFHDSEKRVAEAFEADNALLVKNGYQVLIEMHQPGYIRAVVRRGDSATKIEWAHDSAWRFMPTEYHEDRGYSLHPVDLATNKILALAGRDEPRDFLDVIDVHDRILTLGALCWAACGKDPGFTPDSLLELLRRRGKYHPEEFLRLKLNMAIDLVALKQKWLKMLDSAQTLVRQLPAAEVGCLYYSLPEKKFVSPPVENRPKSIVPHFGKMGGVLPRIMSELNSV